MELVWQAGSGINHKKWTCLVCEDQLWRDSTAVHRHEEPQNHQHAVRYRRENSEYTPPNPFSPNPETSSRVSPPLRELLEELSKAPYQRSVEEGSAQEFFDSQNRGPNFTTHAVDYSVHFDMGEDTELQASDEQRGMARLAEELHAWLLEDSVSDDSEPENQEQDEVDLDVPEELETFLNFGAQRSRRRQRIDNPAWFPWSDKETCILDVLRHLPRSLFSDAQMDIILWGIASFGVSNAPSTDAAKSVGEYLQTLCGIKTERQKGPLGHVYYINQLAGLIRQEMGNPKIRPHIHHYPEDSGQHVEHAWQADAWRNLDPDLASPMVRVGGQDFFIHELAKLDNGTYVIPFRWLTRSQGLPGGPDQQLFGLAWSVEICSTFAGCGFVVHQHQSIQFPISRLLSSFPYLVESYDLDGIPDPRNILGVYTTNSNDDEGIQPWTLTSPEHGFANRWRVLAQGYEVLNFAMWLYCDDTSGNVSKKWNKHNSFLFTAAGLPQEYAHQESNVHFLCTSNLAPPLEMLDGITTQLEQGQLEGIWVWDIQRQAMVLMIPMVLAMLGDNPMQSEFACHVGLAGKFFCHCCFVKGRDADDETAVPTPDPISDNVSVQSDLSDTGDEGGKKRGRCKETIQELIARAKRFVGMNETRSPENTIQTLRSIFTSSQKYNGKTQSKKIVTQTGVKDTFLESFSQQIVSFVAKIPGNTSTPQKQRLVDNFVAENIPSDPNVFSPKLRANNLSQGLDPHRDTPVEILHVILLGFVKYYWRDVIARLSDPQKEILTNRLASVDVSSMGLAQLAGETLVKYAQSLTGRDFRAIAQVAPFVLYDLIPKECYEAWLSLSALIPLVWQPVINHLDEYLVTLELAIDRFLDCAANWTPRWFNKPKFHIIKHLPMHIRRFGPAILYATEGFESFNAIIRDHSVHSNHQAPSRDIGRGFAQCSRIRHLLHGGVFFNPPETLMNNTSSSTPSSCSDNPMHWVSAGPLPLKLARTNLGKSESPVVRAYRLNVTEQEKPCPGRCVYTRLAKLDQPSSRVLAVKKLPNAIYGAENRQFHLYEQAISVSLERYSVGQFVVFKPNSQPPNQPLCVGEVHEILQALPGADVAIFLKLWQLGPVDDTYKLHCLQPGQWTLIKAENVLCSVNTQHRCKANGCDLSDFRLVREERETTQKRLPRTHHYNPNDRLLNTNQMRCGVYIQALRPAVPPLNRDNAIQDGAAQELQSQIETTRRSSTRNGVLSSPCLGPPFRRSSPLIVFYFTLQDYTYNS
ncbi:hypothetical protein C8R41DRAFT_922309 [Lentinula lateritia]|uniref:Uncharacterized protein n=1 Tax=Lentinula lateritia TaxID=40482 RepID=A0ABQ8VD12_9AGAR|nr:hypothetical protein C8R41DRAFT_922309 [Lentinula lateritia]